MSLPLHLWTADRLLVGISTAVGEGLRRDLRDLLGEAPTLDALLDLLTADGLANTVPFVLAAAEPAGVRVIIRGDLRVTATRADGTTEDHDAGRAATWHDDVLTDVIDLGIATGDQGSTFVWLVPEPAPDPAGSDDPAGSEDAAPSVPDVPADEASGGHDVEVDLVDGGADLATASVDAAPDLAAAPGGTDDARDRADDAGPDSPSTPPTPAATTTASTPTPDYSGLLGDTVYDQAEEGAPSATPDAPVDVADADDAAREAATDATDATGSTAGDASADRPPEDATGDEAPTDGDGLVGRTIYDRVGSGAAARAASPGADAETTQPYAAPSPGPGEVQAVHCPAGHPNPPAADTCRGCGAAIVDQRVSIVARPVIARLVFERGPVIDVDRTQIIGRGPAAPTGLVEEPNLITVPNPDGDISREHTAVRLEGWDVVIEDLGSTNGTEVHLPGREPQRLHDHDPILVVPGTRVTLAGAVRFLIESPDAPGPSRRP